MKKAITVTILALVLVGAAWAQGDPGFGDLNSTIQPTAAVAQPGAAAAPVTGQNAPGPAAPYYGYSPNEYGNWSDYNYYSLQRTQGRYENVRKGLKNLRRYYYSGSYESRVLDQQLQYGESLYVQWRRYQNPSVAYQLQAWLSQMEGYVSSSGYYGNGGYYGTGNGGYYGTGNGGYYGWDPYGGNYGYSAGVSVTWGNSGYYGPYYDNDYRYGSRGYYDYYPRAYYGNLYNNRMSDTFYHGVGLGDSISHIVRGSRRDNDLELVGGILGTAGNVFSILGNTR